MKKRFLGVAAVGAALFLTACASIPRPGPVGNASVPEPAKSVDVQRYMGRWYEQYRYEASFQRDMDFVTADYSLNQDGSVRVVNRGRRNRGTGEWKVSTGRAEVVDTSTNAKLKVSFFRPFYGAYWVLDHGDNYEWSIVGEPSGRYLWVLTRNAQPSQEMLDDLQERVRRLGYNWDIVRRTRQ